MPDTEQAERQLKVALAWVNARRVELGLPPLETFNKAVKGSTNSCLLARALTEGDCKARVGYWNMATSGRLVVEKKGERLETDIPEVICQVAHAFDLGRYPQLLSKY